jgi:hypothetical protein
MEVRCISYCIHGFHVNCFLIRSSRMVISLSMHHRWEDVMPFGVLALHCFHLQNCWFFSQVFIVYFVQLFAFIWVVIVFHCCLFISVVLVFSYCLFNIRAVIIFHYCLFIRIAMIFLYCLSIRTPLSSYFVVYWSRYCFTLLFIGAVIALLCCLLEPLLLYFVVYWSRYWFTLLFIGAVIDLFCCLLEPLLIYSVVYLNTSRYRLTLLLIYSSCHRLTFLFIFSSRYRLYCLFIRAVIVLIYCLFMRAVIVLLYCLFFRDLLALFVECRVVVNVLFSCVSFFLLCIVVDYKGNKEVCWLIKSLHMGLWWLDWSLRSGCFIVAIIMHGLTSTQCGAGTVYPSGTLEFIRFLMESLFFIFIWVCSYWLLCVLISLYFKTTWFSFYIDLQFFFYRVLVSSVFKDYWNIFYITW